MSLKKASRTKSLSLSGDDFPLRPAAASKPKATFATAKRPEDTLKIMKYIDDNVIGKGVAFLGPYGRRKVVYADYASSGRSLQFLEDYINKEVLPAFGDYSCISAVTGLQSHLYDNEARDLVRAAVGAIAEDEIVFCDNPAERLCYLLSNPNVCDLSQPQFHNISHSANHNTSITSSLHNSLLLGSLRQNSFSNTSTLSEGGECSTNLVAPILFVSTSEPVANLRSWIDAGWQIERIAKNHEGFLDLVDLEKRLQQYAENRRKMVGLFSGASRLTGILADDVATTILLHQYDALSIWDHSMAASCAPICTNPVLPGAQKDAIFFHCNRLVGGVQAPGVLVIKRKLIEHSTSFLHDSVGVVSAVRAGLVLQLKESLGSQAIMGRMEKTCKQMLAHVRTIPEIVLLGPPCTTAKRLTTLCFMVRHPRGAFLHHRFVVAVLNDVFGIQATADNIISDSLGINPQLMVEYEKLLNDESLNAGCLHPGYTRITFPFFMPESEVGFILEALKMVATEAWKLLPQYEVDERTGEWRHHSNSLAKERKWLGAIRYIDGKMLFSDRRISGPGTFPQNYSDCLQTARNLFNRARKTAQRSTAEEIVLKLSNAAMEKLRWYMLSGEAHELLLGHSHNVKNTVPFDPTRIPENASLMLIHRHHSLSALDIKRFKSRSLPASPLQISTRRQNSSSPCQSHSPTPTSSPPMVRFSVGGEVTTMLNPSPMASGAIVVGAGRDMSVSRNRCHSWGAASYRAAIGGRESQDASVGTSGTVDSSRGTSGNGGGAGGGDDTGAHDSAAVAGATNLHILSPQTRISLGLDQQHPMLQQQRSVQLHQPMSFSQQQVQTHHQQIQRQGHHLQQQQQQQQQHQRPPLHRPLSMAYGSTASPPIQLRPKQRSCSCSSQTDLSLQRNDSPPKVTTTGTASPTPSLPNLRSLMGSSCGESTEDIQAYVKEVTKELATEIKSEIREVISKVEDVLESTDSIDLGSMVNYNSLGHLSHPPPVESKRDSISTSDVVDYLREFSKEMTNEVKSEIRDVVNAVDEIISPEGFLGSRKNSPPDIIRSGGGGGGTAQHGSTGGHKLLIKQRFSDVTPETASQRPRSADNEKHRSESFPRPNSAASPDHHGIMGPPLHYTGAISKHADLRSSMSSQDSGINMNFCDATEEHRVKAMRTTGSDRIRTVSADIDSSSISKQLLPPKRLISEPAGGSILESEGTEHRQPSPLDAGCAIKSTFTRQQHVLNRTPSIEVEPALVTGDIQWHNMPKEVWKQAAEALDEYKMLKNGDRVLVCLSGSSSSLCLLHLLRQFCRARQLNVELGAITIGETEVDPRALMLYLKELGVTYFYEPVASDQQLEEQLLAHAYRRQYTILAMASTLDKLANEFLVALLYRGELSALQAVQGPCSSKGDAGTVKIIRPLLYLREKTFEDFSNAHALPTRPSRVLLVSSSTCTGPTRELLRSHETVNPNVYTNIRSALKPILSLRSEPSKSAYEMLRSSLNTRE
ncbi:uncharacterized protein LOC125949110 isoform X1 [Anopheles darlingi]|uniref:uncharacterized protein LOC125949110 isoform X1 n=1 Tax=Anopheles darlingi TaxID=43151 RepID=UPI0021005CA6|nr:uncharacterized protein LOC125949110 isoform X1 [Anopheles darlingi]XP_049531771.1 uncharacterized protein LOC125949110 isoform X1 [Anopheles darlingi]